MPNLRRSLLISFAEKYSTLVIYVVSSLIIARLLSPSQIGVFSVAAGLVAIAHTVRDVGVTAYLIQATEFSVVQLKAALGVTMLVAWTLAAVLIVVAGPAAAFYHEPGITSILHVLAANFLLIPFGSVALALMRRQMNFGNMFRINLASAMVQASMSVGLSMAGYGYMSLAWASLAGTIATVVVTLFHSRGETAYLPSLKGAMQVVSFGSRATVASIASELGNSAPDLINGRMLGFESVGIFSRALGFVVLFEQAIMDSVRVVALPYFAAQRRAGGDMGAHYSRAIENITVVMWPLLACLALLSFHLIHLLYGPQWVPAAPLAKIITLGVGIRCLNAISSSVIMANGDAQLVMKTQLSFQVAKIILLLVGSMFGLHWVALGLVAAESVGAVLFVRGASKYAPLVKRDFILGCQNSLLVAVGCAAPVWSLLSIPAFTDLPELVVVTVPLVLAVCIWYGALCVARHPMRDEIVRARGTILARLGL